MKFRQTGKPSRVCWPAYLKPAPVSSELVGGLRAILGIYAADPPPAYKYLTLPSASVQRPIPCVRLVNAALHLHAVPSTPVLDMPTPMCCNPHRMATRQAAPGSAGTPESTRPARALRCDRQPQLAGTGFPILDCRCAPPPTCWMKLRQAGGDVPRAGLHQAAGG